MLSKRAILFIFLLGAIPALRAQIFLTDMYMGWTLHENEEKRPHMDRILFTVNALGTTTPPAGIEVKPYSWMAGVHRIFDVPFNRHSGLGFGLGFTWHNLHHNGDFVTDVTPGQTDYTHWQPYTDGRDYKINKLTVVHADAVAQLRLRLGKKSRLRFYPGFKFGYVINDFKKYKDEESKIKIYNTHNLMAFTYGPWVQVSVGRWAISGYYSLTPLLKSGRGDEVQVYTAGITYLFL